MTASGLGRRGNRAAYAYVAAAFVYLAVFVLYPIARAIWISLTKTSLLTPNNNEFIGLQNFEKLIESGAIQHTLWVTLVFVVAVTSISMVVGVGAASSSRPSGGERARRAPCWRSRGPSRPWSSRSCST